MRYILLLLVATLSACGGGGSGTNPAPAVLPAPVVIKATALHVIGNSLTLHGPSPTIGWNGNWGMAASTQYKDFAHVAGASLAVPTTVYNIAELEHAPFDGVNIPVAAAPITATTIVVVQLGDAVSEQDTVGFEPGYSKLLDSANKGMKLICISTWFNSAAKDAIMKRQCESHGGKYVYVGDLRDAVGNTDRTETIWAASPGIDAHPHDWGMSKIAERITAAVK